MVFNLSSILGNVYFIESMELMVEKKRDGNRTYTGTVKLDEIK